jgi:hypothetical protein
MLLKRMATVIVAALCGMLVVTAPAQAKPSPPYPPGPPKLTVSPSVVEEGDLVRVSGRNFGPFDRVTISVHYLDIDQSDSQPEQAGQGSVNAEGTASWGWPKTPKTPKTPKKPKPKAKDFVRVVTADARGRFSTLIRLNEDGIARITAVGRPSGIRASARVIVLCDEDGPYKASNPQPVPASTRPAAGGWATAAKAFTPMGFAAFGYALRW